MKNSRVIGVAAALAAGVATYFIRKRMNDNRRGPSERAPGRGSRHRTNAFAKAKSAATGQAGTP